MRVGWLSLKGFRSYESLEFEPDPTINVLIGDNGAGKTNVLEAIGYISSLRSFRGAAETDLINDDSPSAILRTGLVGHGRERLVEIQLNRSGPRQVQVDKNRIRRTADMLGVLRAVTFLPDDLDLIKRGPAYRRDLLDSVAVQLWPAAHIDQSEFDRALRQRNAFLKAGDRDEATLSVWDSRLAQSGGRVLARRSRVLDVLASPLTASYQEISQTSAKASLSYRTSWGEGELGNRTAGDYASDLVMSLEKTRRADFDRRLTTSGPHRDEPSFYLDTVEVRTHGSQGEQRSMALAVKLASHRAITDTTDEMPMLLLDDVFSELDASRSDALARSLPLEAQTIITSARPDDVPLEGSLWRVDGGIYR